MNARTILAIARKDIVDAIKNRYLLLSLVMPVGLSLMFQLLFSGSSGLGTLTLAVYDPGGSRLTAQLRAMPDVKLVEAETVDRLMEEVKGNAVGGVAIPEHFDKDVDLGKQPELTVYLNLTKGGGARAVFRELITREVWSMREEAAPAVIVWSDVSAPEEIPAKAAFQMDFYLLVMFLVMSLTMTGGFVVPLLMVEEKEKHTMEFLLVSPVTPAEIATGKAITGLVYCGLGAGILIALNHGWSGLWPITFLAVFLGAGFMVAAGLLMGSVLHTAMQVNTWSTLVLLVLLAPSWLTVVSLPPYLEGVIRITPTYYLVQILNQSLTGQVTPAGAAGSLAVIAGCMVVTFGLVVWVIRRQEL